MTEHDVSELPSKWVQKIVVTRVPEAAVPGDCWLWQCRDDALTPYGRVSVGDHRTVTSHRAVYEFFNGELPSGRAVHVDHLCRITRCCAPHHLEAVTHQENLRRGWESRNEPREGVCSNGHQLTADTITGQEFRQCAICRADRKRELDAERAEFRRRNQVGREAS